MALLTRQFCFLAVILMWDHPLTGSAQQGTAFTYQGLLQEDTKPANGIYNLHFGLFDAKVGGTGIGGMFLQDVAVDDGLLTVELDFGTDVFDGSNRWLEITVNVTKLSPRQPITGVPYALQTRGIHVSPQKNVGIGSDASSDSRLKVVGDSGTTGVYVENASGSGIKTVSANPNGYAILAENHSGGLAGAFDGPVQIAGQTYFERNVGINVASPLFPLHIEDRGELASLLVENDEVEGVAIRARQNNAGAAGVFDGDVYVNEYLGVASGFSAQYGDIAQELDVRGDLTVDGHLTKSSGSFKIDHPLDPANKFLVHSFVESPEMMNIYNGNVVTDKDGYATINMPEWFEALNREFRYQLTIVDVDDSDEFVFAKVVEKIRDNKFRVRTSVPQVEVSWQVTGVRQDAWAEANRIEVEVDKVGEEVGRYLTPELFGHGPEKAISPNRKKLVNKEFIHLDNAGGNDD